MLVMMQEACNQSVKVHPSPVPPGMISADYVSLVLCEVTGSRGQESMPTLSYTQSAPWRGSGSICDVTGGTGHGDDAIPENPSENSESRKR